MALFQSTAIKNRAPIPTAIDGTDIARITAEWVIPAAGHSAGDIIEMHGFPGGYILIDGIVTYDALDSNGSKTLTIDMGILSGTFRANDASRTIGAEFLSADTTGRAGGVKRIDQVAGFRLLGNVGTNTADYQKADVGWGLKINANAATWVAGGLIRATLLVSPAHNGK